MKVTPYAAPSLIEGVVFVVCLMTALLFGGASMATRTAPTASEPRASRSAQVNEEVGVGDAPRWVDDGTSVSDSSRSSSVGLEPSIPASLEGVYQESMVDLNEVYLPIREALQYHVDFYLDQIAGLSLEQVRELFREDWPNGEWTDYYMPCLGRGTLKGRLGFPTPEDVDRLWNSPGFRQGFITYLDLEHRSFVQHELGEGLYEDPGMVALSKETGAKAGEAWRLLWETPDLYPNWPFVMEVARRHLR